MTDLSEKKRRLAAVQRAVEESGHDLLIVVGRGVISHYGHLLFTAGYCPVIRMAAVLVPPVGDPILVVTSDSDRALAVGQTPIADIRVLDLAGDALPALVADVLAAIDAPCIGIAGIEEIAPPPLLAALHNALPAATIDSATGLLLALKAVKSDTDIVGMRASAALADNALAALVDALRDPACTLAAAAGAAQAVLAAGGASKMLVYASKGPHYLHRPKAERLDTGELLTVFVEVANADGYWTELARLITRGDPSPAAAQAIRDGQALMVAASGALVPGQTGGAAYDGIAAMVRERGYRSGLWLGHGVGVDHDLPTIGTGDTTPLVAGMTIAFHPHLVDPASAMGSSYGDTLLVGDAGAEPLSRWPLDPIRV